MELKQYFSQHQILTDGAMGTYYAEKYLKLGQSPELQNRKHPERIMEIHKEYLRAGAQLIRTNSFSSNLETLFGDWTKQEPEISKEEQYKVLTENVAASFLAAKKAASEVNHQAFIAGDIGPIPEHGTREPEELLEEYFVIGDALLEAGAEIIWFETFSDFQYMLPVARYLKEKKDVFIMGSFCLNKFGYTRSGISARSILKKAQETEALDGVGFNCGVGSTHMYQILKHLDFGDLIVSVIPNSGYPDVMKSRLGSQENTSFFCENMQEIASLGVNMLGGCCGTTPAYIEALHKNVERSTKRIRTGGLSDPLSKCIGVQKENNGFYQKLMEKKKPVVVELDPPHNGSCEKIIQASLLLKEAGADLITFADSPMGKLRADSILTGAKIQREIELSVMPHVTCRDKNRLGMGAAIFGAHMNGIRNLLLITGDPVPQGDRSSTTPVFDFNSMQLMEYVKQMNQEYFPEDPIVYGGAVNQGRANLEKETERMKKKCAAGADFFLTQPIFGREDIERIAYIKKQTNARILCGIMPLVSYRNANFMKNEIFGVSVPEEILARYHKDMSREEGEKTGQDIAMETIEQLQEIADGYYFMAPFNRASMICEIMKRMKEACLI